MKKQIAMYLRLSKAEKQRQTSSSIERQRQLLCDWVYGQGKALQQGDAQGYCLEEYVDDGSSGMSEKRPAYEKLLAGVLTGKIAVVLVKDFSRLSRDSLVLARLREQTFPMCGVRLVAIGDGYDSRYANGGLGTDFRGLFYEYYCHDISRKVKGALQAKKESGEYATASVPYGYRKVDGQWKIQPEEAEILRFLFCAVAGGRTYREAGEAVGMDAARVWYLVHNPVYLGWQVWHRYENHLGRVKRTVLLEQEQWRVRRGAHEAIVGEEVFAQIQRMSHTDKAEGGRHRRRERHVFSGITKCGECGRALCRGRRRTETLCCVHCNGKEEERIALLRLLAVCRKAVEEQLCGNSDGLVLAKKLTEEQAVSGREHGGSFHGTAEKTRLILRELFCQIEIDREGKIYIWWNFRQ